MWRLLISLILLAAQQAYGGVFTDVDVSEILRQEIEDYCASGRDCSPLSENISDIHYYLYTRENPTTAQEIFATEESITGSNFDGSKSETIFITHGFSANSEGWCTAMKDDFLSIGDFNVVELDWRKQCDAPWYFEAVENTYVVANCTELIINAMVEFGGLDVKTMTLLGHSLGAQTFGHTGMYSRERHNRVLGRIVGMDPAGPEFIGKPEENRLDPSDADMVIAIHTNGGLLITGEVGYYDACGHVDFYPHGGHHQPGCTDLGPLWDLLTGGCSHGKSHAYTLEGITKPTAFMSLQCDSWDLFTEGSCDSNPSASMGYHTPNTVRGSYMLDVNEDPPHSQS